MNQISLRNGAVQLGVTVALILTPLLLATFSINMGGQMVFVSAPLILISGVFLARLFILQHDCAHMSLFPVPRVNRVVGNIISMFTLVPFEHWKREHDDHHRNHGNLEFRGVGDIWLMTRTEFIESALWKKIAYKLYRNPFIMLFLGPVYMFFLKKRFPSLHNVKNIRELLSFYLVNIFIFSFVYLIYTNVIYWNMLLVCYALSLYVAAVIGIFFFYVQHQFDGVVWFDNSDWSFFEAGRRVSSHMEVNSLFDWLTGYIGYHDLHHLRPDVPSYGLSQLNNEIGKSVVINRISLMDAFKSFKFKIWDERSEKLVPLAFSLREAP